MKVYITPRWQKPDKADGGIRRVVEAQEALLPQFGVELVADPRLADVIATHGSARVDIHDKPIVSHGHGLYWDRYDWGDSYQEVNRQVAAAMSQAVAHTAPSKWVAHALTRGMLVYPEVIYHGVDPDEWQPDTEIWDQFILWNKARPDFVSDPNDMQHLAALMPDIKFKSTLGNETRNVQIIGTMPLENMKEWVRHAGLYLCTARETFGIGTLEAMACGVPVVGWAWGGQSEIVRHGETGFLAAPYDYEALVEGIRWAIANRDLLGSNARQDVLDRWTWEPRIKQYAKLYLHTKSWWDEPEHKVSIIVTCHNLAHYLDDCLKSVAEQEYDDWECLIVDDASTDDTERVAKRWVNIDSRFKYLATPENLKLPGARNYGFTHSKGRYILPLDADDMLAENALLILAGALDQNSNIHIAYGHLDTVNADGNNRERNSWPFKNYSWYGQMAHLNQLPYSAMIRREVMERTGGYRLRHWRAEDAPLWIRATSFGFRAEKVTEAATIVYRMRSDSKSNSEPGDGDWTSWFPFRMGAASGKEGHRLRKQIGDNHPRPDLVPWGAQAKPKDMRFWYVPDCTTPLVSVVIPVGPGHEKYIIDALDSVMSQTFQNWEAIVVNATGKTWEQGFHSPVAGAPWAFVIDAEKRLKPAAARNLGATFIRGEAILWLDADDLLLPHALEEMVSYYLGSGKGLVYTDWLRGDSDLSKPLVHFKSKEFVCGDVLNKMRHSMMCLVPRWAHEQVGGFDESFLGWEDWDYLIALQDAGACSYRTDHPGFVYRFRTGTIREESFGRREAILKKIREKWSDYYERRKQMPCRKCPEPRKAALQRKGAPTKPQPIENPNATVLLEYQGPHQGKVTFRGPVTGTQYRFRHGSRGYVYADDASIFLQRSQKGKPMFVRVEFEQPKTVHHPAMPTVEKIEQPDFPEMPDVKVVDVSTLTIAQLKERIVSAENEELGKWLDQELKGKARQGALKAIRAAMK